MNELRSFIGLGFHHITAPGALDHLLFLLVLVAPFRLRDWRRLLALASAFTLGHSVTLALVATRLVHLPATWIEFLIPLTIVAAGLSNLRRAGTRPGRWAGPLLAGMFGLIHGAGFANFLREMFVGSLALPLFGFNLGIELGQLSVVGIALLSLTGLDRMLRLSAPRAGPAPRTALVSLAAAAWATVMAVQRLPW